MKISSKGFSILCLIGLLLGIMVSGCSSPAPVVLDEAFDLSVYKNNDFLITAQELKGLLGSESLVLVDCNRPEIYKDEHIPGAIGVGIHGFCDTTGQPGRPGWGTIVEKAELIKRLEALGIDNSKTVVFYSDVFRGPGADGRAVWQLRMAGLDNVKFLVGGLSYWKALGYEVVDTSFEPTPVSGVVVNDYDESYAVTKEYIYANLGNIPLLDVRTESEYKGSQRAGEPRGGHIKGAILLEWIELLEDNGLLKSPQEITAMMDELGIHPEDEIVVYCTMGIRSGYATMVLRAAGFEKAKNYEASIYEWGGDESMPMEK